MVQLSFGSSGLSPVSKVIAPVKPVKAALAVQAPVRAGVEVLAVEPEIKVAVVLVSGVLIPTTLPAP